VIKSFFRVKGALVRGVERNELGGLAEDLDCPARWFKRSR